MKLCYTNFVKTGCLKAKANRNGILVQFLKTPRVYLHCNIS